MDTTHLHLMLNHAPLFGSGLSLLLLLVAIWRRSDELKRVACGLLVLSALVALPVYFTGEPAEEAVEHLPGVAESVIDSHEGAAKIALGSVLVTGVVALAAFGLFRGGRRLTSWFTGLVVILSLTTALLMARTANLGGKVRHTEIRAAGVAGSTPESDGEEKSSKYAKDHDD